MIKPTAKIEVLYINEFQPTLQHLQWFSHSMRDEEKGDLTSLAQKSVLFMFLVFMDTN